MFSKRYRHVVEGSSGRELKGFSLALLQKSPWDVQLLHFSQSWVMKEELLLLM